MPDKDFSHRLLVDKLSVKTGMRVAAIGITDTRFLEGRTADVSTRLRKDCDVILLLVEQVSGLTRIEACIPSMKPAAGLWVIYPKGRKDITQAQVMAAEASQRAWWTTRSAAFPKPTPHCGLSFV